MRPHALLLSAVSRALSTALLAGSLGLAQTAVAQSNPGTRYTYDGNGNVSTATDPLNRITRNYYDGLDRLYQVTDPAYGTTRYAYDAQGNLTQVTDPNNLATSYHYNGFSQVTRLQSPDTGQTTYQYDSAGNLLSKTDARGVTATYRYDAANRVIQIVYPDETVNYTYDSCPNGKGRVCQISDASGTTHYQYDPKGRVTQKSQTVAGLTQTVSYRHNAAGQLDQLTTPSGQVIAYGYRNGKAVAVSVNGQPLITESVFQPFGPRSGWSWANGHYTVRPYDKQGRTTAVTYRNGTEIWGQTLTWDDAGRITGLQTLGQPAQSFGYDALDRLTQANLPNGVTQNFTYNATGDRLSFAQTGTAPPYQPGAGLPTGTSTYSYTPGSHRLKSQSGATNKTYTYDAMGNQTGDGQFTWTYRGNSRMQQVSWSNGSPQLMTLDYNALGQRVRKVAPTATTRFVYDGKGHLLGEYDSVGNLVSEMVWLDDLLVAIVKPKTGGGAVVYYAHADHLGTPRAVTRPSDDAFVWRWDSDPFGTSVASGSKIGSTSLDVNLRFPGQYFDSETNTHYNYFRDFSAVTGRYLQADPLGLAGGDFSIYSYVSQAPTNGTDDLGLRRVSPPWITPPIRGPILRPEPVPVRPPRPEPEPIQWPRPPHIGPVPDPHGPTLGPNPGEAQSDGGMACKQSDGDPDCVKASKYHLRNAGITDEHAFKKEYGAVPNSRFDICACKDGSIVIKAVGKCGDPGPGIPTYDVWR